MQYVAFYSIKGYLLQKDIAKDQTKNNFIRNSSLVTSGLNFLKDNILRRDELRFKLITRL
ncbi:unknown [Prevotella sp. CAG:255]|nr:unknown [Prevotella sp. CAG:255]